MFRALLPGRVIEPESFDLPMTEGPECGAFCIPGVPAIHTPSLTSSDPHPRPGWKPGKSTAGQWPYDEGVEPPYLMVPFWGSPELGIL